MSGACPVCGSTDLVPGIVADNVPAHAVRLAATAADAKAETRGRIELVFCRQCALVFNAAFQAELLSYDTDYESTQTHSPTYRTYMEQLTGTLLARVTSDGAVVDVGCGQGEFLASFAQHGSRPLIGFDPALDKARMQVRGADMHPSRFRADDVDGPVSLITCKMTLEHVEDPLALLFEMAKLAERSPGARVFLQLPNCRHVFSKTLFSDIIYEHVNYFTEASLTNACTLAGLEVEESWISYQGQHLNIMARPGHKATPLNNGTDEEAGFTGFIERFHQKIGTERELILTQLNAGGTPALWGAGSKAVSFLNFTGLEDTVNLTVDINPLKQNTYLPGSGLKIISPNDPALRRASDVFVMNPRYEVEIGQMLNRLGLAPTLHMVA